MVYLLPGLSVAQRRAALRRLRISARRGQSPELPAPQLALALAADRVRTAVGRAGAVFRLHPAGSTVPVMVVSAGAIAFLALSAVSIRVIHHPPVSGQPVFSGVAAGAAGPDASVRAGPGGSLDPVAGGLAGPNQAGSAAGGQPGQTGQTGATSGNPRADPAGSGTAPGPGGTTAADPTSGSGTLAGSAAPTPTPGGAATDPAPASPASSAAAPAASATTSKPSATPTASKTGVCVNVGPLGVCL